MLQHGAAAVAEVRATAAKTSSTNSGQVWVRPEGIQSSIQLASGMSQQNFALVKWVEAGRTDIWG